MKNKGIWLLAGGWPVLLIMILTTLTAQASTLTYKQIDTITGAHLPPAGQWIFDMSWLDQASHRYYFSDSSNGQVDIINATNDQLIGSIGGFTGYSGAKASKGPDGLVTDNLNQLWVGDGNSTVKVVNLTTNKIVTAISTGGSSRADEMAYDPKDQLLMVTNGTDSPAFVTFISVTNRRVVGKIYFSDSIDDGLEQPLWDASTQHFYVSVPTTSKHPGGVVAVIDPKTKKVIKNYTLPSTSHPTGLTRGPGNDLLVGGDGRTVILNIQTGHIEATIPQVNGVDEVWYNVGDHRYYLAAGNNTTGSVLAVVDAKNRKWLTNIRTVAGSHSVAVDASNNHIFVPLSGKGIGVYSLEGN